ncbi:hypothetical protein D3C85_1585960 [compost metagenome]
MPECQRLARFDGELPQRQLALFAQGHAQKIGFSYRHSTRGEDQINILQFAEAGTSGHQIIRQNTGIDDFTAQAL